MQGWPLEPGLLLQDTLGPCARPWHRFELVRGGVSPALGHRAPRQLPRGRLRPGCGGSLCGLSPRLTLPQSGLGLGAGARLDQKEGLALARPQQGRAGQGPPGSPPGR